MSILYVERPIAFNIFLNLYLGLVFVDGEFFNEQKKFCLRHLKSFGLGTSLMEERVAMEVSDLMIALKNKNKVGVSKTSILCA